MVQDLRRIFSASDSKSLPPARPQGAAGFAYCFPNASHDKKAHDNGQDSYQPLFMYRIHRLLFLTQVFFLQILLLRNVRFVCLSGSILSCKSLRYS